MYRVLSGVLCLGDVEFIAEPSDVQGDKSDADPLLPALQNSEYKRCVCACSRTPLSLIINLVKFSQVGEIDQICLAASYAVCGG